VHGLDVAFHRFAVACGHDGSAVVVHLKHQPFGLLRGDSEVTAKNVGHIGHQVDRIVPDQRHPGSIEQYVLAQFRAFGSYRHSLSLTRCRWVFYWPEERPAEMGVEVEAGVEAGVGLGGVSVVGVSMRARGAGVQGEAISLTYDVLCTIGRRRIPPRDRT